MRKPLVPLVCVVLSLLWSCGPKHTELVKVVDWSVDESLSWEGHIREELLTALGRPTFIRPDGKGGDVYSYERIETRVYARERPHGGQDQVVETRAIALFWIDKNGVVYEQWIRPGLKKKTQVLLKPGAVP
jgi:hypothetical protein